MLLATALAALLMTAVAMLIALIAGDRQRLAHQSSHMTWSDALERLLHDDLENAQRMHISPHRLTLLTTRPLNRDQQRDDDHVSHRSSRPTLVHYELDPRQRILLRVEHDLEATTNINTHAELACVDVSRFIVGGADDAGNDHKRDIADLIGVASSTVEEESTTKLGVADIARMTPIPDQIEVTVVSAHQSVPDRRWRFVLR